MLKIVHDTLEILGKEYISKLECCDECFCEVFCILNGRRNGRVPYKDCHENIIDYVIDVTKILLTM